jgi:nucleoside-diphosphate-sugar epimerase
MQDRKVLLTGAAGYVAAQLLPCFRQRYELTLTDVAGIDRDGGEVAGVETCDLTDSDRGRYAQLFEGKDAVVHLGYKRRRWDPLDDFFDEHLNVAMAYNVFRSAYDAGVRRVVMASSNHAADWYEHNLIHERGLENLDPYRLPLSDNFYGWAKATYEHIGFLFASGVFGRKLEVVMVRIGAPRVIRAEEFPENPRGYKRDLGAYISPRDLTQLFRRAVEAPDIENEYGIPWQVVYGISDNTRAFWSLESARRYLGYSPQDDSEVVFAEAIAEHLTGPGSGAGPGRVGGPGAVEFPARRPPVPD